MRKVHLTPEQRAVVADAAAHEMPEECCGILIGVATAEEARVVEVRAVANVAEGDRRQRYLVDPRAQLAAHREARAAGHAVLGYYHSHPAGEAVPSDHDRDHAWPGIIYLIIAPAAEGFRMRAWSYDADRRRFDEIAFSIEPTDDPS